MPNMVMLQWIASVNAYLKWNKSCKTRLFLWNNITSSLPARHRSAPKGHDSNLSPKNPWSHFSLTKKNHCRLGIFLDFFPSQMMSGHWMPDMPGCLFLGHLTTFQLFGHEGLQCLEVKVLQKWVEANSGWGVVLKSVRLWYMHHDLPKVLATLMVSCGKNTTYMDDITVCISIPKNRRSSHFWKRQLQDPKPPWNPGWFFQSDYHEGAIQNVVKEWHKWSSPPTFLRELNPTFKQLDQEKPSSKHPISAESPPVCLFPNVSVTGGISFKDLRLEVNQFNQSGRFGPESSRQTSGRVTNI